MAVELEIREPRRIAWIEFDQAHGLGLRRALRAVTGCFERRADPADEVEARVVGCGQLDRYLARAQVAFLAHCSVLRGASAGAAVWQHRALERLRTMVKWASRRPHAPGA